MGIVISARRSIRAVLAVSWLSIAPAAAGAQSIDPQSSAQHHHQPDPRATIELFPVREASGTAWLPDTTPMHDIQRTWRGWQVMLHGTGFAQYLIEPGDRHRTGGNSTHQLGSVNWGMVRARQAIGSARLGLRTMVSLEPWTLPDCGYISFLATGETCDEDTIHDRQHPHELFMELAADYDRPLSRSWRWQIYGGLAGEPALGPPGFPHRVSAALNPIAPIGHHWLDSSHITFGVLTASVYERRWKMEMSAFNGREPDENRGDLDLGPLDSVSARVTYVPVDRVALQASAGRLREAEQEFAPQPRSDVDKLTASFTYHRPLGPDGFWASTIAYGVSSGIESVPGGTFEARTQALLIETSAAVGQHTWFGRVEAVEKPAHDLHAHEFPTSIFTVGKLQVGYVREFRSRRGAVPGLGATASLSFVPEALASRYGGRVAPGFGVFASVRPFRHAM
ncbi:MAG TPA: hypothetical protein VH740_03345 [Vicinamibacterales bacterium]